MTRKEEFIRDCNNSNKNKITVVLSIPKESDMTVINYKNIDDKIKYYMDNYNKDLKLKKNNKTRIISWVCD